MLKYANLYCILTTIRRTVGISDKKLSNCIELIKIKTGIVAVVGVGGGGGCGEEKCGHCQRPGILSKIYS